MYLIDETYFKKELFVPNLNEMDSDTLQSLEIMIDRYSRQFLRDALGDVLFVELDSNITDGVLDAGAPQKWIDFVDFLLIEEGIYKGSILAKFVYHFWLTDFVSNITGTGEKIITSTDALAVNSTQRLTNVWNDFVSDNIKLLEFLKENEIDYPDAKLKCYPFKNQHGI